jgi:hypothetical protein
MLLLIMWTTVEVNPFHIFAIEGKGDCILKHHALEIYEGMEVKLHTSLTMALGEVELLCFKGESPRYPMNRRLGQHHCWSTHSDKKELPLFQLIQTNKQTPWPESASELYRPSDRCLSAKWLPTFADKGCHVVSVMDPYGRILDFLDSRYFSIK